MITTEQIKGLQQRVEALHKCLDIEGKRADVAAREEKTLAPDFWNDPKAAEAFLKESGIATNKHYPIPMHMQKCYADLGIAEGSLPIAEEISRTELSLPMYYGMTEEQIDYVIDRINAFE